MNQTPPSSGKAQKLGEEIVGELIGRPGIDMVLVDAGSLENSHSTDLLTLQSLEVDFVYLDWRTPEVAMEWLGCSGIVGKRFPHPNDAVATLDASPGRRIYFFDLQISSDSGLVCQAVLELLANRQTRTFSLTGGNNKSMPATKYLSPSKIPAAVVPNVSANKTASTPIFGGRGLSEQQLDELVELLNDDELA